MTKAEIRRAIEGAQPRVHPFGFIQVDVPGTQEEYRLHVWPDQPLQQVRTARRIHSHSFDLRSTVLTGAVTEIIYDVVPAGELTHESYRPSGVGEIDRDLLPHGLRLRPIELHRATFAVGAAYRLEAYHFHDAQPVALTATLMTITRRGRRPSTVLIPIGEQPLPRSPVAADPAELWAYIHRALA